MIEVKYLYDGSHHILDVSGHAGAGEKGCDIVCAAASMLAWTICERAENVPEFYAKVEQSEVMCSCTIICSPEEEVRERCREMFDTILTGFQLLEENFGEYVRVRKGGKL